MMIKRFFSKADNITAISFKVKKDLAKFFGPNTHEKIEVIYNPIQDVNYDKKIKKNNSFLYIGRANDPIKRFNLVRQSLSKIKDGNKNIIVCGIENPNFGNYLGHVSNEKLNILYNEANFLFLPSKAERIFCHTDSTSLRFVRRICFPFSVRSKGSSSVFNPTF